MIFSCQFLRRLRNRLVRPEHQALAERLVLLEVALIDALEVESPAPPPDARVVPTISIIMPVRDRKDLVAAAIRSVQAQGLADWELLVVDDGSTDGTTAVVEGFLGDPRIRLQRLAASGPSPSGPSRARNLGLSIARGTIITYLDSDNLMLPGYLAGLAHAFATDPGVRCAYGALLLDKGADPASRTLWQPWDRAALLQQNFIDLNVFAHHRSLVAEVGGFDETLPRLGDWDFILRCTEQHVPRRLVLGGAFYRSLHADRITNREELGRNRFRVLAKWLPPLPRPLRVLYALWHYPQLSETYAEAEIRSMQRRGVEVEVWSENDPISDHPATAPVHRGTLEAAIAQFKPHIVHIHWLHVGAQYGKLAAASGLPVTVRGHSFDGSRDRLRHLLAKRGISGVYVFPHHLATSRLSNPRLRPLPVAFDTSLFRPAATRDRRLVVRTASALPNKDLALFFALARRMPDFHFVLAAATAFQKEAYVDDLRAMVVAGGSAVDLRVDMPRAEVAALLGRAGIYLSTVLPPGAPGAHPVGMQIGIAEAMASGAVPVVRNLAPLPDYVGPAGLLYDDEDGAEAAIRATTAWDDATWREASRRALDQAYLNHADDLVLQPLLEHWLSLVAPSN